jgi:indole-3-glycerol phosphate synthase
LQVTAFRAGQLSIETKSGTILDRMVEARRGAVEHRKRVLPEAALRLGVLKGTPVRDFSAALARNAVNIIAELKKASPSRGVIREAFDPPGLAADLEASGAAALSVLTEEEHFQGSLKDLRDARKAVKLPVLRKDFVFDPWQVWETRANDADSFLLIVSILNDTQLGGLLELGRGLGMEALVEVHTSKELRRAVDVGARIIGVNNRDLKTLEVRMDTSYELVEAIPDECIAVSESGLRTNDDLKKLRQVGFDAFLIGEQLMQSPDPAAALRLLLPTGAAKPA